MLVRSCQTRGTASGAPVEGVLHRWKVATYYHRGLIGSTNLITDESGTAVSAVYYTAFGEILDASGRPGGSAPEGFPRYRYAGQWGYESGLLELQGTNPNLPAITLQHVGHRWYQPDTGRFIQRDPIGIRGGLNVYVYVLNEPMRFVDPSGLFNLEEAGVGGLVGGIAGGIVGGPLVGLVGIGAGFISAGYEEGDLGRLGNALRRGFTGLFTFTCVPNPYPEHMRGQGGTMISGPPKIRMFPPRRPIDDPPPPEWPGVE